ncbi:hypothetical protein D6D01_09185 [Aureobasidium pullulans]|uniref:Uncharacterized protein n=1 Tax=Aureobasidium pullulans TaxID=5580 RepID=A0A4S9K563_AURPU|nr:hypothetical protein D6D01_09185 [Aureobasidium pullulans]
MSGANSSSFDNDGDSLMQSGNSSPKPSTPNSQIRSIAISDLSPPDSQGVPHLPAETMPTVAPSASGANMNGKRPISSIDHSQELQGGVSLSAAIPTDAQVRANAAATYQWTQAEDAPGYAWKNKKAQDECSRAWDTLVDKNRSIGNKYGDPYAMADRELAHMNSRQQ